METVIYLSLVTAAISFTITETKVFEPLREWLKKRSNFLVNGVASQHLTFLMFFDKREERPYWENSCQTG
jgi:hypothetical protein